MHLQDRPDLDLSAQVAKVKEKTVAEQLPAVEAAGD